MYKMLEYDEVNMNDTKTCSRCNLTKPLEEFAINRSKSGGYDSWCKICHAEYSSMGYKTCSECGKELHRSNFYKDSRKSDGLYSCCKVCHNLRVREYNKANPEVAIRYNKSDKGRLRNKMYKEENKEKIRIQNHKYYMKNKKRINRYLEKRIKELNGVGLFINEISRALSTPKRTVSYNYIKKVLK